MLDLPGDALINLWLEINKRKQADANALSYSAALVAGTKFTEPGKLFKVAEYLPYNNEIEAKKEKPKLSEELLNEIIRLSLPPGMVRDLIKAGIIKPLEG